MAEAREPVIRILTIEREYGSGAAAISHALAERLGWKLWDEELTARIAGRLKCEPRLVAQHEERVDSMFYRLVKTFMRGSFEARTEANVELLDAENLVVLFEKVIEEIAREGNAVIVGRGAPWFLRNREDVVSVFLYAPHAEKLRRSVEAGMPQRDAEDRIERVDAERVTFVRKYYGLEWPHRPLYDLMVNTKIGDNAVVDLIVDQIKLRNSPSSK
jgi:cytidylate kinase